MPFIIYRDLAIEDFLTALEMHRKKGTQAYLPGDACLRDIKIEGRYEPRQGSADASGAMMLTPIPVALYFLNQYDMIRDETTAFVVVGADRSGARFVESTAKRLRTDLRAQSFETLFRVDPRYGLVVGAQREAVDTSVRADRNRCYVTLVLTDDASHPEASLLDYVDRDHQRRYKEIFEAVNQTPPKKRGVMGFDLSKLRGGGLKGEAASPFRHEHIRYFAGALHDRYGVKDIKVSLIYKDVTDDDLRRSILDPKAGFYVPVGECRFFSSTEELLA